LFRWNLLHFHQSLLCIVCFNTTVVSVEFFENFGKEAYESSFNTTVVSVEFKEIRITKPTKSPFQYNCCFGGIMDLNILIAGNS